MFVIPAITAVSEPERIGANFSPYRRMDGIVLPMGAVCEEDGEAPFCGGFHNERKREEPMHAFNISTQRQNIFHLLFLLFN